MISILSIAKSKYFKKLCLAMACVNAIPLVEPTLYAMNGGPTQPEYQKFSVIGGGDMVDPFTGDVKYNIPLFDVGGYPVALSYTGNISPTQDAGWVGLGWTLNVGSIGRSVRGVPDDMNGDDVEITHYEKPHHFFKIQPNYHSIDTLPSTESSEKFQVRTRSSLISANLFKKDNKYFSGKISMSIPELLFDNYRGIGIAYDIDFSLGLKKGLLDTLNSKIKTILKSYENSYTNYYTSKSERLTWSIKYLEAKHRVFKHCSTTCVNFGSCNTFLCEEAKYDTLKAGMKYRYFNSRVKPDSIQYTHDKRAYDSLESKYGKESRISNLDGILNQKIAYSSFDGISYNPLENYQGLKIANVLKFSPAFFFNSREGLTGIGIGLGSANTNSGWNSSFTIPFAARRAFPEGNFDYLNQVFTYNFKTSNSVAGHRRSITVNVIHSVSRPKNNNETVVKKAYGYFYQNAVISDVDENHKDLITDCETDQKYWDRYTKVIPQASKLYDVFTVSGSGVGGSFHAFDIKPGIVGPAPQKSFNVASATLGGDFSKGVSQLIGFELGLGVERMKAGPWLKNGNKLADKFSTSSSRADFVLKNSFEFQQANSDYYSDLGWNRAIAADMKNKGSKYRLPKVESRFVDNKGTVEGISAVIGESHNHVPRQQVITYLTAFEAARNGFMPEIMSYHFDNGTPKTSSAGGKVTLSKLGFTRHSETSHRKRDHVSQFMVTQPDGKRYFYGVPVYSVEEVEVFFSVDHNSNIKSDKGYYNYSSINDTKLKNDNGIDHVYHKKKIKGYATSYLLSAVLSDDYSDLTDNGPTPDDLGGYVKFNYGMGLYFDHPTDYYYKWRTPYDREHAHYNEGFKSDELDDKAYYSYGQREMWYMHSIETKDRIVLFYLGDREDGYEVIDEHGGKGAKTSKYLKKIAIFTREDFEKLGLSAIPLQTINLEYSYDLCGNVPDFNYTTSNASPHPLADFDPVAYSHNAVYKKGKLTLHKIWITYGNNPFPSSAPYIFEYKGKNPNFHERKTDRWGMYSDIYNPDRPYTEQDKVLADANASAWMMTDVYLPSGGHINFEYECDDYTYVMDREAMQMVKLKGASAEENNLIAFGDKLQNGPNNPYSYLIFEKKSGTAAADYFRGDSLLYFSCRVNVGRNNLKVGEEAWETVSGFAEIDKIGEVPNSNYGYVKIKPIPLGRFSNDNLKTNVITKMAWQYGLANVPQHIYPSGYIKRDKDDQAKHIAGAILGILPEMYKMIIGNARYFSHEKIGYGAKFKPDESYIRLHVPGSLKRGGGHRVKKVSISDNWAAMTAGQEQSVTYSTTYTYTTKNNSGVEISSGVASYEPLNGGDENPFKQPANYKGIKSFLGKKNRKNFTGQVTISYDLEPFGEEFYPSAMVGYSKITINSNSPEKTNIRRHRSGYTVLEFYTAKDFPVECSSTTAEQINPQILPLNFSKTLDSSIVKKIKGNKRIVPWVNIKPSFMGATQGFYIEQNDMHGKPKAQWQYPSQGESPTSGVQYFYQRDGNNKLVNEVTVLTPENQVETATCGYTLDPTFYASRVVKTQVDFALKNDIEVAPPAVAPQLSFGLNIVREDNRMFVITKLGYRQGILDSTVVHDKGAHTSTKNIAWDAFTGQVLLSRTENEYRDPIFSLQKPAYWMYTSMGGAFQNAGHVDLFDTVQDNSHNPIPGLVKDPGHILYPGDEISIYDPTGNLYTKDIRAWVLDVDRVNHRATIIDEFGESIEISNYLFSSLNKARIQILRSGYRNLIGSGVESVTLGDNPIRSDQTYCNFDSVLNASAGTYSDKRKLYRGDQFCVSFKCNTPLESPATGLPTSWYEFILQQNNIYNEADFPGIIRTVPIDPTSDDLNVRPGNCCSGTHNEDHSYTGPYFQGGRVCYSLGIDGWNTGETVNPFLWGIQGVWRPHSQYAYYDKRNASAQRTTGQEDNNDPNTTNMRHAGYMLNFGEFWSYNSGSNTWTANSQQSVSNPWTWSDSSTQIDYFGNSLQNINALGIFNAVLYAHGNKLTTAAVPNAQLKEVLFDGFEDYGPSDFISGGCNNGEAFLDTLNSSWFNSFFKSKNHYHWPVYRALIGSKNRIHSGISHTGQNSLQLGDDTTVISLKDFVLPTDPSVGSGILYNRKLKNADFSDDFSPLAGKAMIASLWVLESYKDQFKLQLKDRNGNAINLTTEETPVVIDGWRRLVFRFTIPTGAELGEIRFINKYPSGAAVNNKFVYLDDFRIFPANTNMVSYVYRNRDYRLMATLDANNFAAINVYDQEGNLVSQKIETEKGILSSSEQRTSVRKTSK